MENGARHLVSVDSLREILPSECFEYKCNGCSDCCRAPGIVYFTHQEMRAALDCLQLAGRERDRMQRRIFTTRNNGFYLHDSNRACFFLEAGRCSIYPVRPLQCRAYPFWTSFFRSPEDFLILRKECTGIGSGAGARYSLLQTVRRINQTYRDFLAVQDDRENPVIL